MDDEKVGVALEYSGDVPKILAIARGLLYDTLIRIAGEYNITVYRDSDLAQALSLLPEGSEIPEPLFKAVSEVLAYCYRINSEFKIKLDNMGIL
ncbi:MAG: EscU/YscU/HrcU family type III secretion system export apparatus switch protein [Spirochaetes bacterium]|nr:EscU/YscU/HrcU family type III secretion system export apparatus switch protein [Spirochaetota bacterium]